MTAQQADLPARTCDGRAAQFLSRHRTAHSFWLFPSGLPESAETAIIRILELTSLFLIELCAQCTKLWAIATGMPRIMARGVA